MLIPTPQHRPPPSVGAARGSPTMLHPQGHAWDSITGPGAMGCPCTHPAQGIFCQPVLVGAGINQQLIPVGWGLGMALGTSIKDGTGGRIRSGIGDGIKDGIRGGIKDGDHCSALWDLLPAGRPFSSLLPWGCGHSQGSMTPLSPGTARINIHGQEPQTPQPWLHPL